MSNPDTDFSGCKQGSEELYQRWTRGVQQRRCYPDDEVSCHCPNRAYRQHTCFSVLLIRPKKALLNLDFLAQLMRGSLLNELDE